MKTIVMILLAASSGCMTARAYRWVDVPGSKPEVLRQVEAEVAAAGMKLDHDSESGEHDMLAFPTYVRYPRPTATDKDAVGSFAIRYHPRGATTRVEISGDPDEVERVLFGHRGRVIAAAEDPLG